MFVNFTRKKTTFFVVSPLINLFFDYQRSFVLNFKNTRSKSLLVIIHCELRCIKVIINLNKPPFILKEANFTYIQYLADRNY